MARHIDVEFTIEPFIEGEPGPHVTAAVRAVETLGFSVDFGPFGSTFSVPEEAVSAAVAALMDAAYKNGATHVSVHAERPE